MYTTQTVSTALTCTMSDLVFLSQDGAPLTRLQVGVPVTLSTTITFSDQANGEFAKLLMAANLSLRITFHAKPHTPDRELELGSVMLNTVADVLTYTATLALDDLASSPLSVDTSYQLGAIVRVGTDFFSVPSLIRGFVDGPALEGASPKAARSTPLEADTELTLAASPKAARRKEAQLDKHYKK